MEMKAFDAYLKSFNARDYATVVAHYAPDGEISFAGTTLRGHDGILRFYEFFHAHVIETITVQRYAGSDTFVAIEAIVQLEGKEEFDPAVAESLGFAGLQPLQKGTVVRLPQFIHYHLKGGLITKVVCVIAP